MLARLVFLSALIRSSRAYFRSDKHDPLTRPLADAFSTKLSESTKVKQPAALLAVGHTTLFISSFLGDAVLIASLPLTARSEFRVFAHGAYCTPDLRRCAILNGARSLWMVFFGVAISVLRRHKLTSCALLCISRTVGARPRQRAFVCFVLWVRSDPSVRVGDGAVSGRTRRPQRD